MGLHQELLDLLVHLPAIDSPDERRALVAFTGLADLGFHLDWQGSNVAFAGRLIDELSRRGQAAMAAFLAALPNTPQVQNSLERQQALARFGSRLRALEEVAFREEFPLPAPPGEAGARPIDPAMLAASLVNEVLAPYYKLGAEELRQQAGENAVALAERVVSALEPAVAGDVAASALLDVFRQNPELEQPGIVGVLKARLAADPALAGQLAATLTAAAEPGDGGLRSLVEVSQRIGLVSGDVVGAIVGSDVLDKIRKLSVRQDVDTISSGATMVGAVLGGSGPVNVGGKHHHGDEIDTGGGPCFGGDVGRDIIGRDLAVQGDQVSGPKYEAGTMNIYHGVPDTGPLARPSTPSSPLIEEVIRLDVAAPPAAILESPFDLAVAVRQPDAPTLAIEDLTQVKSQDGTVFHREEEETVMYRVAVTAASCDIQPPHYILKLRPCMNSAPCWFQITPHRLGRQSIIVTAYQQDEAVAAQTRLSVEIQVPVSARHEARFEGGNAGRYPCTASGRHDEPSIAVTRRLLLAAFSAKKLRRFCQDQPTLRPIVDDFSSDHGKSDMVDRIIDYCETRCLFDKLLAEVEKENPKQYERFAPMLFKDNLSELSGDDQVSSEHNGIDSGPYDIARDLILEYLERKNLARAGFDRIRQWIDPEYDDDFLMEVIRRNPAQLRRVIMKGGNPGVTRR